MAERISGLSIDLSMNDAGLSRSMTNIKNSFRDIKRSAQVNLNNIKFDSKNIDTYKKNVDELSKSFNNQKKNVDDLKSHYDKMVAVHGEGSKEAQAARIEYNKQADELNKLGHAVEDARTELHKLNVENSGFTKIGNAAETAGGGIQTFGGHVKDVGGSLTKWITAPVLGAITAAGGLTAAFGWNRLVGLDNAKAQLKGMGYSLEEVDDITGQVSDAIQGGMMTMAEGTSVAAGAMAAGVEQGDELSKYLKLVDAAAVGANKPVGDMAMIFNRVQGSGKLMTQELNMIEDSMPGFSAAMAENAGVTMEEFRKMVTDGEVTSNDFLTVMDTFAGGMAEAHADTWQGMVANTKANIGILGESMLSGVFEQSKESIREFLDLLRSDAFRTWAAEAGETIGQVFTNIVDKVRTGVQCFTNLSDEQKKMIGIFSAVAVAAGPLLTAFGSIAIFVGGVVKAIAPLFLGLGKLSAGFTAVKTGAMTFGAAFPKLASFIGLLTGPVGITIGVITLLGTAFTVAYAKSETFRNIIQGLIQRFKEFIPTIVSFAQSIYSNFMNLVIPAVNAVKTFFIEMFQKIRQFWQSDGQQVITAITNGVNIVKTIVSAVMPVITKTINVAFKLVLSVVKMVWENIKGVINGSLNVIMGLVRVFTGLFTGDFSKMWQGVKQIFSGAIQVVWNGFQLLFYGRIIKGVGSLVKIFSGSIRSLWNTVVNFFKGMFTGSVTQVTNMFKRVISIGRSLNTGFNNIIRGMVSRILGFFRNLLSNSVSAMNNMRSRIVSTISNLRTNFTNIIRNLYNGVRNIFNNIFNAGRNIFNNMRNTVTNLIGRMRDGAVNGVTRMKDRLTTLFTNIKDKTKEMFTNMVDGAKELPGKLGSAIRNGASKAVDGVKSLGNKMTGKLGDVVNKVIGGLNSVTSKIGISAKISEWKVPKFSTGTGSPSGKLTKNGKIAMDTIATVGDKGKGNGKGTRELVHYPNGKVGLYDDDATIFAPKGTTIFSNKETEALLGQIPKFSEGTGLWSKIKSIAGKAVDYITNPKKIFDDLIGAVGANFGDLSGFAGKMVKGAWKMIKDGMFNWVKGKFSEASVGKSQKWMDYPMTTPYSPNRPVPGYPTAFNGGRHYGIDYGMPVGVNITAPLAGKVTRMSDMGGGNVARLKSKGRAAQYFMHMSSVKTGSVGIGESVGRSGNTGKWTTGPHVHWQHEDPSASYIQNRNTKNPLKAIKGHLKGGQILSDGLFNLHKGEYVINPNEPTEAMKLLAVVGKKLAGKSKQTREVASVGNIGSDNSVMHELLDATLKQNQILMKLLNKDTNVYMDSQQVGSIIDEHNAVNASLQMF